MNNLFSFGILGCGLVAGIHAAAIQSLNNAQLRGVADTFPMHACSFAQKHAVIAYESYDDMLSDPEINVVCICTPSKYHAEQAIRALRAHKHVVLEKPMALNTQEADSVIQAAEESGCLLTVVSQLRFSEDVRKVRRLVEEGTFGQMVFCSLTMRYWREPTYFSMSDWHGRLAYEGGGALMNQGIHGIDLLQYLVGMPTVLCGKSKTLFHDVEVEDTAAALLSFENGALGTIEGATCTYPGFSRRLELHGSRGYVILRENQIERLMTAEEQVDRSSEINASVNTASAPGHLDYHLHARQIENLLYAVMGAEELLIDAREGKRAIALIEAIYRSAQENTIS